MHFSKTGVSIRKTRVGKGVFALRSFRKNRVIGEMKGEVIKHEDYEPSYVVSLGNQGVLDPVAPFRFLNHSCEPNARLVEEETKAVEAPSRMWVETVGTIKRGEQITIDYGWPAEPGALQCGCGAPTCRGWIVDLAELEELKSLLGSKTA